MSDSNSDQINQLAINSYTAGLVSEAISLWQAALELAPDHWEMMIYLASALKETGDPDAAAEFYHRALALQPGLAEAHYNLGNIRQAQGRLEEAAGCYRKALALKPDFAFAEYNLGNIFRDLGELEAAIDCYKRAILQAPDHAPSYNNLGNALKHQGNLDQALLCYQAALDNQPDYADAMYNLGNALYEQADFAAALPWFERAQIRDSAARALYCLYQTRRFDAFSAELDRHLIASAHNSPQVATLTAHHAINVGIENRYRFCPQPFDMVYHEAIPQLTEQGATLRAALLADIEQAGLEERVQGRLHHGVQSAGNLFQRQEASFQQLAELVKQHLQAYRQRYHDRDCELIRSFPEPLEFESAWYIRMRQGGHLDSHIHEGGWVSGVLYLALPSGTLSSDEGCLELGTHGDNYPLRVDASKFPQQVLHIAEGDIVLFPANLFHRTIPYSANQERICIAFDLRPTSGVS